MKYLLISLLALSLPVDASGQADVVADDYAKWFPGELESRGLVGGAFAIVNAEGVLRLGAFGLRQSGGRDKINEDTVFRIASVSKTFAAGLTGILVEDGYLNWEDEVVRYVPDFRFDGNFESVLTRHVLGQSTGLIPHAYDNLLEDGVPLETIFDRLEGLTPICQPGHCYSYQNSVYSLIEPILSEATSEDYSELLRTRIFEPLDMQTASLGRSALLENPNHARPHVRRGKSWTPVSVKQNYYNAAPAAGVNASILDMAKWLQAQLGSHPEVLSTDTLNELARPRVRTRRELFRSEWRELLTDAHYGLGWRVYQLAGESIVYHSGWVAGYRADVAWSPVRRVGLAVLLNVQGNAINTLSTRFWSQLIEKSETRQ